MSFHASGVFFMDKFVMMCPGIKNTKIKLLRRTLIMKKIFAFILAMIMSFSLIGCANNDENNAAIQVKIDEASALADEMTNWYKDNGFLEGDSNTEVQATVDQLTTQIETVKTAHLKNLDAGGYSDEDMEQMLKALEIIITALKTGMEELKNYQAPEVTSTVIDELTAKYIDLVNVVNEASTQATANGWEASEEYNSEFLAAAEFLQVVGTDIENPDTMDEEYMMTLIASMEELILIWQDYLTEVSEPFVVE